MVHAVCTGSVTPLLRTLARRHTAQEVTMAASVTTPGFNYETPLLHMPPVSWQQMRHR
jgi:hypothetical protein